MKRVSRSFSQGSILAYSLIVLGLVLVASIGMMAASVANLRSVSLSDDSTNAFQIADSGAQAARLSLKSVKASDTVRDLFPSQQACAGNDPFSLLGGSYRLVFYGGDPEAPLSCGDRVSRIISVKSTGSYRNTTRAVKVELSYPARIVGQWKLNETSGLGAPDSSSFGNNGVLSGAPEWGNNALKFDGTNNDVVTVNHSASLEIPRQVSISFWFNVEAFSSATWTPLVSKMNDGAAVESRSYSVWLNNTDRSIHLTSSDDTGGAQWCANTPSGSISTGSWHHYVGVIDREAGVIIPYIDGVERFAVIPSCNGSVSTSDDNDRNTQPVRLGGLFGAFSVFNGQLDDVRIYEGVLSSSEVTALFAAGRQ